MNVELAPFASPTALRVSDSVRLMRAVLGPSASLDEAQAALDEALADEVEPLLWCAAHHGISRTEIMRRGAAWGDLAFFETVPRLPPTSAPPPRLELLSDVHICRRRVIDRDVAFAAPDFFGVLRLKRARLIDPSLRNRVCLVPAPALRAALIEGVNAELMDSARQNLARVWPYAAAQLDLGVALRWIFAIGLVLITLALLLAPLTGQLWLLPFWCAAMLLPTLLRLAALGVPPASVESLPQVEDDLLPVYSVLVPLRDEANMVDQLCRHLGSLDYPADRLEIIFVVESRSAQTVAAVEQRLTDSRFNLVVVPDATPRTKPKALNFALPFCRGEFVVVFDAEDRPEPQQLRRVVAQFRSDPRLECIQARLLIDNADRGPVPALFAGDYAGLFAVMLPAFANWGAVMPLGGTSNHFRLKTLRSLGGWDAFNVTEDADLGVRLGRRHLRTATTVSTTREAAPTKLAPWLGQRTRWIKGWMQTFVVHNRRPRRLYTELGMRGFWMFQLTIVSMLLAPLLHIGMFPMLAWMLLDQSNSLASWSPWWMACLIVLILGHGTAIVVNMTGLARVGSSRFWLHQLLLPLYWLLIAWATVLALREFVYRPFHWFKTPHQASETSRGSKATRQPVAAE